MSRLINPDLYLVLDIPEELSRERLAFASREKDRLDLTGRDFMERVRSGYLEVARNMDNAVLIDGTETPDMIHHRIREILVREMPTTFGT